MHHWQKVVMASRGRYIHAANRTPEQPSFGLSVCLPVRTAFVWSVGQLVGRSVRLSVRLPACLPACLPTCLPACLKPQFDIEFNVKFNVKCTLAFKVNSNRVLFDVEFYMEFSVLIQH